MESDVPSFSLSLISFKELRRQMWWWIFLVRKEIWDIRGEEFQEPEKVEFFFENGHPYTWSLKKIKFFFKSSILN